MTIASRLKPRHLLGLASGLCNGLVAIGFLVMVAGPGGQHIIATAAQVCAGPCNMADPCLAAPASSCPAALAATPVSFTRLRSNLAAPR